MYMGSNLRRCRPSQSSECHTTLWTATDYKRALFWVLTLSFLLYWCSPLWRAPLHGEQAKSLLHDTSEIAVIKWWPCPANATFDCGFITVPTDYFNASAGVTRVALGRYKATKSPRKGMILLNPGGPGGPGASWVLAAGPSKQVLFGEHYDMVGFDPRGIGETVPTTMCFRPGQYDAFSRNTVLDKGFDVSGNISDAELRQVLLRQQHEADAMYQTQLELCDKTMGDQLRYMGTTTVVRDIDFMTRVIEGEDALINFYGGSYGSVIGQYLVNMFPDRVGRVVIDGIVDARAWSSVPNYKWYRHDLSSTETAYSLFLEACSRAGPSSCGLAQTINETPSIIRNRLEGFFDQLYKHPLPVPDVRMPGIVTSSMARGYVFRILQRPMWWQNASLILRSAMQGNGSELMKNRSARGPLVDMEGLAVTCNDAVPLRPEEVPSNEVIVEELLHDIRNITPFTANVITSEPDWGCQYWPVRPPERFSGPWNHTLRNPMLVISNMADPITPLYNGRMVTERLGDSARLLIRDGPGHTSSSMPSLCVAAALRAYFEDGTLPEKGLLCPVDVSPFSEPKMQAYSVEQLRIIKAVEVFGETSQSIVPF